MQWKENRSAASVRFTRPNRRCFSRENDLVGRALPIPSIVSEASSFVSSGRNETSPKCRDAFQTIRIHCYDNLL